MKSLIFEDENPKSHKEPSQPLQRSLTLVNPSHYFSFETLTQTPYSVEGLAVKRGRSKSHKEVGTSIRGAITLAKRVCYYEDGSRASGFGNRGDYGS
ncbi:hypothetical protein ACSQ67_016070 [Phaseolus vulgaris]